MTLMTLETASGLGSILGYVCTDVSVTDKGVP